MDAIPSAPALPFGPAVCCSHELGQRSGLPMKAYLMSEPAIVACVCRPQYWVQNPELAVTSADVSTKYTPLVTASSGFCTQYCGWHTHGTIAGSDIKY